MSIKSYSEAGVDIEKGERFADFIKNMKSKAVSQGLGSFAGGIELDLEGYKKPVLLSATDGVGTKLIVAQKLKKYDTVGIDLVAMSVNDLIVCGAKPLLFLDYIACGKIEEEILHNVMKGIVKGCELAECELSGGETAEMPDLYKNSDFDLAGFCVGLVEKEKMLPQKDKISSGDSILGIPSAGVHSNGLSLARKVIPESNKELFNELLIPTKIYIKDMSVLLKTNKILGAAHITGGGLEGNFLRVLPENLKPKFYYNWEVPNIFKEIQKIGKIDENEMYKVFNMGIGMAMAVKKTDEELVLKEAKLNNVPLFKIGEILEK